MSYKKLDDFIIEFSNNINKLRKLIYIKSNKNECKNIVNKLYEMLDKRKRYALDDDLWTELYYNSIYEYSDIKKIGNIPCTLVTKHNHILPFYMKQNLENTTIVHFDTHPDMNLINKSSKLPKIYKKYKDTHNEKYIDEAQDIVWDIGAAISGVIMTTGIQNYIWCMPEWIPDPDVDIEYFLKQNKSNISMYTNDEKIEYDDELLDVYYTKKYKNDDLNKKYYVKIQTGIKDQQKKIIETIKKGDTDSYILDIDLDYFCSNGSKLVKTEYYDKQYDVSSIERTKKIIINEDNPRNYYEESDDYDVYKGNLDNELKLINKRIKFFLSFIKKLKNRGYTPSLISICDSTNIEFSLCTNCNSKTNGYVPRNLAFIIHKKVYEGLLEIF